MSPLPFNKLHQPLLVLGGALLWGAIECVQLWRARGQRSKGR